MSKKKKKAVVTALADDSDAEDTSANSKDRCAQCHHLKSDHSSKGKCFFWMLNHVCECENFIESVEQIRAREFTALDVMQSKLHKMEEEIRSTGKKLIVVEERPSVTARLQAQAVFYNGWLLKVK